MSRLSIRLRVTLVFAAVMAVVLAATGFVVYDRQRADLNAAINRDLATRADGLATAMRVVDAGLGEPARSILRDPRQGFSQVLRSDGAPFDRRVQHGQSVLSRAELERARAGPITIDRGRLPGAGAGPVRLFAKPIDFERQRLVTVVASSLSDRNHALETLRELLLIGGPVALLLAAVTAYWTVAAALRPVEAMRRRAESISGARADARLPVPAVDDELHRLGETLNSMLGRIEASVERERAFVDDASHELRTPLAAQRTELELALRHAESPAELRAAIASAMEEADRLSSLAEDLLVLARSDQGQLAIEHREVEVGALLRAAAARAGRAGVTADEAGGLRLSGDPRHLERALADLVDNALEYGATPIRLWARSAGQMVELHVTDAGPGFPADLLRHAFERFRRADASRGTGGTGLGLAIVEAIAVAHGGVARAANVPDGGGDVWITVPNGLPS